MKDLYIDGEISREDYDTKAAVLKTELEDLKAQDRQRQRGQAAALELPEGWRESYAALSDTGKKVFWSQTLESVIWQKKDPPSVFF